MTDTPPDIVDALAGVPTDSARDALRRRRPVTRDQLQASFDALFAPRDDSAFSLAERALVAAFATRLTADDATAAWYLDRARALDADRAHVVAAEASLAATAGPFGLYREVGLAAESTEGRRHESDAATRVALGERLASALDHAHLLTYRPREADAEALDRLLDSGWSVDGVVTLSQLIAFVAFQQRVVAGLRTLAETETEEAA